MPASAAEAMAMAQAGLGWLAAAEVASLTTAEQAGCLRSLERARSLHTAARSRVLAAFHAQDGCAGDGHGSTRTWLRWQTRIGGGAASDAMGWMRRLSAHPAVADALAQAEISESFARQVCEWTDLLPAGHRGGADQVLLAAAAGAAAGGAELGDLSGLAEEIRRQTARPDTDDDHGFDDRGVHLARTFRGAGRLGGDLTPQCAAALAAVLEALGKRAGPEDLRSKWQRDHDALEEGCRRLIAAGCLPERAGQPTQIMLHMTLDQLRSRQGGGPAEAMVTRDRPAPCLRDHQAQVIGQPPSSRHRSIRRRPLATCLIGTASVARPRTFPTDDPYVRRPEFGRAGLAPT